MHSPASFPCFTPRVVAQGSVKYKENYIIFTPHPFSRSLHVLCVICSTTNISMIIGRKMKKKEHIVLCHGELSSFGMVLPKNRHKRHHHTPPCWIKSHQQLIPYHPPLPPSPLLIILQGSVPKRWWKWLWNLSSSGLA